MGKQVVCTFELFRCVIEIAKFILFEWNEQKNKKRSFSKAYNNGCIKIKIKQKNKRKYTT